MADNSLALRIVKDHEKLDRTFSDLEHTLLQIIASGTDPEEGDFLEDARADLSFALDEMLEHFGVEEEAIFEQLRASLPDVSSRLDSLEASHEFMCKQTSALRRIMASAQEGDQPLDVDGTLKLLQLIQRVLSQHNHAEVQLFLEALERLDAEGQRQLRDNLDRL